MSWLVQDLAQRGRIVQVPLYRKQFDRIFRDYALCVPATEQLQNRVERYIKRAGIRDKKYIVYLGDSSEINGLENYFVMQLSRWENENLLPFTILHELAHSIYGHCNSGSRTKQQNHSEELAADAWALDYLVKHRKSITIVHALVHLMSDNGRESEETFTHPSALIRSHYFMCALTQVLEAEGESIKNLLSDSDKRLDKKTKNKFKSIVSLIRTSAT